MRANVLRTCRLALLAASLCWLTGCWGGSHNPTYFPWYHSPGDVIQTHAKPPGLGYYANFDPYAIRLEVRPLSAVNPVQTQHVIIATVYDSNGKPRRDRRVEWKLSGVGHILEVDESGCLPGRGWDLDGKNAISYTNYTTHQMTRGNVNPRDDFVLRPGQTWCVVTSPVEGDTFVSVYAPEISNWDKRLSVVNVRWVDALWEFPPPGQARSGAQHVFTTKVFRYTDKQPLANYRVRYRIVGGPPAVLLPSQTQEAVVISDLKGLAQVGIRQKGPAPGVSTVEVEIIRAPDPTEPSGSGVSVAKGITSVEWLAPSVALSHTGPSVAGLGQEATYVINVQNNGKIESNSLTVTNPVPPGLSFLRSEPPAFINKQTPTWTFGTLPPGQAHTIKVFYTAQKTGTVTNCAVVETEEGLKDQKCVNTDITEARLKVGLTGPNKGAVGAPMNFTLTLENPGSGPAAGVLLTAKMSEGLEPQDLPPDQKNTRTVTSDQGTIKPLEQRVIPLKVVPLTSGKQTIEVYAVAAGGLKSEAPLTVIDVLNPQLGVSLNGPKKRYVDRPAVWNVSVVNNSDIALNNVMVRDLLPPQLLFEKATDGGVLNEKNEVVWDVGMLQAGQTKVLQVTTRSGKTPALANNTVIATAEYNLRKEVTTSLLIEGVPALKMEMIDLGDPVEVGKQVTYLIELTNTGSESVNQLELFAKIPPELKALTATGPSTNKIDLFAKTVFFDKLSLEPGKTFKYEINCLAEKPGDVRFRVDVKAASLTQPLFEEESTTIVGPASLLKAPPISVSPGPFAPPPAAVSPPPGGVPPVPPPPFPGDAKPLPKM